MAALVSAMHVGAGSRNSSDDNEADMQDVQHIASLLWDFQCVRMHATGPECNEEEPQLLTPA